MQENLNTDQVNEIIPQKDKPILSLSSDNSMVFIFIGCILALVGTFIFINSKSKPRDVALQSETGIGALNLNKKGAAQNNMTPPPVPNKSAYGPSADASKASLKSSRSGSIEFLKDMSDGTSLKTHYTEMHFFGNLDLDGELFHLVVSVNGSDNAEYGLNEDSGEISVTYNGSTTKLTEEETEQHNYKKFHIKIKEISNGENKVKFVLYDNKKKNNLLDEVEFTLTKDSADNEITGMDFKDKEAQDKSGFYKSLSSNFTEDKLLEYFPPVSDLLKNASRNSLDSLSELTDHEVVKIGEVSLDGDKYGLYRLSYFVADEENYIIGYKKSDEFYFFSNVIKTPNILNAVPLYYMGSSEYKLKDTIHELTSIELKDDKGKLSSEGDVFLCKKENLDEPKLESYEDYEIKEDYVVVDKFGLCRQFSKD